MQALMQLAQFLSALATVAVGWFACVQLRRAATEADVRRLGAQSRASASSYLLRRRLIRWLGKSDEEFVHWITETLNAGQLDREVEAAIQEARIGLAEVGELAPLAAEGIRNSFVLLCEGLRQLQEHTSQSRPGGVALLEWIELRCEARKDLVRAVQSLEGAAIDSRLLDGEQLLREQRQQESPFGKDASDLALELEVANSAERLAEQRRLRNDSSASSRCGSG